jgi:molybdenum cofactor synthesis domain-containing protein
VSEPTAAIITIGNELVSGDVPNTNGSWLARRLGPLGLAVRLIAAVPDEIDAIADLVCAEGGRHDVLLVTGGLGGTPDDLTREALAAAFGVGQAEVPELAADLRARFPRNPEYVARWARLPTGSRPLRNPLGGAPGFVIGNVWVFPGLPAEMEAMFLELEGELRGGPPIAAWRRTYPTTEGRIAHLLEQAVERFPGVLVGSYPTFEPVREVEVVLKSRDAAALRDAAAFLAAGIEALEPRR